MATSTEFDNKKYPGLKKLRGYRKGTKHVPMWQALGVKECPPDQTKRRMASAKKGEQVV